MKLNDKIQRMNVVSDENLAALWQYQAFTAKASEDNDRVSDEQVYHLGANHAFIDSLGMIETKDVRQKTAVDGRLLTGVVVLGAAVVLYKPAKKAVLKLKAKFRG